MTKGGFLLNSNWPFTPRRLTDIIPVEDLQVLEAGACERLGRATTILVVDRITNQIERIDPINPRQRFSPFCRLLRDEKSIAGGNMACEKCDDKNAERALNLADKALYRAFPCHMGLRDATHVIEVNGQPVAILFSGQYRPDDGIKDIEKQINNISTRKRRDIGFVNNGIVHSLIILAEQQETMPADFQEQMAREAAYIQRIAETEYKHQKYQEEQEFLDDLRAPGEHTGPKNLAQIRSDVTTMLHKVREFSRCQYAIFFSSVQEGDTVLAPLAGVGIPLEVAQKLPHFNWRKAGLPRNSPYLWEVFENKDEVIAKGIRGDNSRFFRSAVCVLPTSLDSRYRGVLIFGDFAESIDPQAERRFLSEIADAIGRFALTELEIRYLERERRRWKSTAELLTHQLGTALSPITTQIGRARKLALKNNKDSNQRINDLLKRTEDLGMNLRESAKQTLSGHVLQLERDDLDFERYPLSVLVGNCVQSFIPEATRKHRNLISDASIEILPDAELDVARMTIVLSNLINNAIKYSYPNTAIYVRSRLIDSSPVFALIEIDDIGDEVTLEDRERIFDEGVRGLTAVKLGRVPGTGLGLWEARVVLEAHGGDVAVECLPTSIHRTQGTAHRVVFSVKIPINQKGSAKGG